MAVQCDQCGHRLKDAAAIITRVKVEAYKNRITAAILDSIISVFPEQGYGQKILNRLDYECPKCKSKNCWIGVPD